MNTWIQPVYLSLVKWLVYWLNRFYIFDTENQNKLFGLDYFHIIDVVLVEGIDVFLFRMWNNQYVHTDQYACTTTVFVICRNLSQDVYTG